MSDKFVLTNGYRVVLMPDYSSGVALNNPYTSLTAIEFDVIKSKTIDSSSDLTTYPTVLGDTIADHTTRKPKTITLAGKFGIYGNKPTEFNVGGYDRLTNVQKFFEYLQENAILCTIVTRFRGNDKTERFESRTNMFLNNINWTEEQSTLDFNMTFTQALLFNTENSISDEDYERFTKENLPLQSEPSTLSFANEILDTSSISTMIITVLREAGLMTDDFLLAWSQSQIATESDFGNVLTSIGVGGLIAAGSTAAIGGLILSGAFTMGATLIVAAIAAGILAVICIASGNALSNDAASKKYKIEQFKLYGEDERDEKEIERFTEYVSNIRKQLMLLDDYISVYTIAANEVQECSVYLGNNYYTFIFTKNNNTNEWELTVKELGNESSTKLPKNIKVKSKAISDYSNCKSANKLFSTSETGYEVYLLNLADTLNTSWYIDQIGNYPTLASCKTKATDWYNIDYFPDDDTTNGKDNKKSNQLSRPYIYIARTTDTHVYFGVRNENNVPVKFHGVLYSVGGLTLETYVDIEIAVYSNTILPGFAYTDFGGYGLEYYVRLIGDFYGAKSLGYEKSNNYQKSAYNKRENIGSAIIEELTNAAYTQEINDYMIKLNDVKEKYSSEMANDLTNYGIMVSKIRMDEFNETLTEIVQTAMEN